MKIAVLASGGGTNLQAIIDAIQNDQLQNVELIQVISDRPCFAIERAKQNGIRSTIVNRGEKLSQEIDDLLINEDLLVLAGFLSILSPNFTKKWEGRVINLHPSLLPKFGGKGMYGKRVHEAVLKSGERISGATVHFVTTGIDEGEVILQKSVEVELSDTPNSLAKKVQKIEHKILIQAIQKLKNQNK